MGIHSGKFGVLDGVSTVRNWSINETMSPHDYVASNTLFGTGQRPGVHEWNGNFGIYGYQPSVLPGQSFSFLGYTAPNDDVTGTGLRYSGTALLETLKIAWGWQNAEIINATADFKGHLALTAADGIERYDVAVPVVPTVIGTKIMYSSDGVTWAEWDNLISAELTLTCKLLEYVTSSTYVSSKAWKGQKPGPVTWSLSVTVLDTIRSILQIGTSYQFRCYVTSSLYFELKWGQVNEFSGLQVDRETGAIMQHTVNIGMNGFDPAAVTYAASVGHVLMPDTTQWWPGVQPGTGSGT